MKSRTLGVILAAMMVIGLLAPAASASVTGAGTFSGVANVGKWFTTSNPCDKSGDAQVAGPGLWLPGVNEDRRSEGVWALDAPFQMAGMNQNASGLFAGSFKACGRLESMVDADGQELGAWCGPSKGFEGKGRATSDDGAIDIKLFDVGWKAVVGNIIVVTGRYQEYDGFPTKKDKTGTIYALVMANPDVATPLDCVNGAFGEQNFQVDGLFTLVNQDTDQSKPSDGDLRDKQCKGDGPKNKTGPKPSDVECKGPGPQKG